MRLASITSTTVLAALAGGCGGSSGGVAGGPDMGRAGDMVLPPDLTPVACSLAAHIKVTPAADAKTPLVPGGQVMLAVEGGSAQVHGATVAWTVSAGSLSAPTGTPVTWTVPADGADFAPRMLSVSAMLTAAACNDEKLDLMLPADWPDPQRTIVIHNPMQMGSLDVAKRYAAFRKIADDHLCAVPYADITTVNGPDFPAFADKVMTCVDAVGAHVEYLVPVWGVPYKVAGRIRDTLANKGVTTVSLDAVLAFGHRAKTMNGAVNAPFYNTDGSYSPTADTYPDHVPWGTLRDNYGDDYFLVARVDGADAAAAMALVERTAQAELLARAGTLAGTVYVDGNRGLPHPANAPFGSYEWGEWEIVGVENVFKAYGKYPIVTDYNSAEFGTAPAPLMCPDALYYAGWYSFGHYNDAFTWKTGAIGAHLDSCSACDIRGMVDWSAMALRRGITATFGAVNEPYVAGLPAYDLFFHMLLQGASFGEAGAESNPYAAWMAVWVGDPLYRPYAK